MDTFGSLIKRRMSCRSFSDEKISRDKITNIINDSVWVPSGSNNQPWMFGVVTDKTIMKAYSDAAKKDWLEKLAVSPHMQQYEQFIKDPNYNIFYNAPALIVVYGNTDSYWYVYDCSMVAYNIHLLAEDAGLGCCWIGFAHNVFNEPKTKRELGVPENHTLVAPIILGYPQNKETVSINPNARKPFLIKYLEG